MVKRKEVKIDEEQIRRVMTGDIPDAVLKNICDDNDTGSPKEDGKEPETKPNRDSCRACRGEEYRHICQGRSTLSGLTGENTPKKKHPSGVSRTSVWQQRREGTPADVCQQRELRTVRTLLSVIAPTVSISCYIDNILSAHLEQYRDELNAIYSSRINLKPL